MRVLDPVCGMEIERERAAARVEWKGAVYYFCAKACRAAFEQDPALFAEVAEHSSPPIENRKP